MTSSWHGGPGRSSSQVKYDRRWTLPLRAVAGEVPQLVTVETSDSRGRVDASWLLVDSVVVVVADEAAKSWSNWAWCGRRGPEGNRRSGTGRMLHIQSGPLRMALVSTMLHHLPLTGFIKLTMRIFYEHGLVHQALEICIVVTHNLNLQARIKSPLETFLTCII